MKPAELRAFGVERESMRPAWRRAEPRASRLVKREEPGLTLRPVARRRPGIPPCANLGCG